MVTYKWLFINRIREYKRLLKNMWIQILGVYVAAAILFYEVCKQYIPIVPEYPMLHWRSYYLFMGSLLLLNCKKTIGKSKPQIVIKPMTLFLLPEKKIKQIITFKLVYYSIKYLLIAGFLSVCTVGLYDVPSQWKLTLTYFIILIGGTLLAWGIYHTDNRNTKRLLRLCLLGLTALGILGRKALAALIADVFLLLALFIYVVVYLKIDYYKYSRDMEDLEKILTAQNFNNPILLSQYAKEKAARNLSPINKNSRIRKAFPVIWKAGVSIFRLGKLGIGISLGAFILPFCIYTIPFLWQIPVMESETARHILLVFGIYFCCQTSVQTFARQLKDIMDKRKDGLYIPVDTKKMIVQFSVIPTAILFVMTSAAFLLLKSKIYLSVLFFAVLWLYLIMNLILSAINRKASRKIYMVMSIFLFVSTNILFV